MDLDTRPELNLQSSLKTFSNLQNLLNGIVLYLKCFLTPQKVLIIVIPIITDRCYFSDIGFGTKLYLLFSYIFYIQITNTTQNTTDTLLTNNIFNFNLLSFRYFTCMYLSIYIIFYPSNISLLKVTKFTKHICLEIICKFMMLKMCNNSQ